MNEARQGRTAAEVAADEEGLYRFVLTAGALLALYAAAYGGWQVGAWLWVALT